uniref:Solute carrier family 12 member 9 n=1 Tax=Ditylenchus dipsaci TaxID=166011 RepID=A0A915CQI4_9BILA
MVVVDQKEHRLPPDNVMPIVRASSAKSSRFQVTKSNHSNNSSDRPTSSAIDLCSSFGIMADDQPHLLSTEKKAASTEVHLSLSVAPSIANSSTSIADSSSQKIRSASNTMNRDASMPTEQSAQAQTNVVPSLRKVSSSGRFTILGPPSGSATADGPAVNVGHQPARRRDTSSAGPELLPPLPSTPRTQQSDTESTSTLNGVPIVDKVDEKVPLPAIDNGIENGLSPVASAILAVGRSVHFNVGETKENDEAGSSPPVCDTSFDNMFTSHKSWRYVETLEHPPIMDFYRNTMDIEGGGVASRPSMLELLHGETGKSEFEEFKEENVTLVESQMVADEQEMIAASKLNNVKSKSSKIPKPEISHLHSAAPSTPRKKFGWVEGVFFRCLLNIFGVMLYLRVSWVAGQAGIGLGCMVVLLASAVTTITALSTCAICTNGVVKGGGAYFLISRSLGPEFGGSIGLIFSVANAVGAAMYVVGFAETVRDLLREYSIVIIDGGLNDVRLIGLVTCICLMAIVFIGTSFESKMQMGLLVILSLSILDYFVGSVMPVSDEKKLRGITGYSFATMKENFLPSFRDGHNFFSVFSIYFPAATGIMAGANISGDLTDPQRAIPLGTLIAILVTTLVYLVTVFATGSTCVRDADGLHFPQLLTDTIYHLNSSASSNSTFSIDEVSTVEPPLLPSWSFKSYQDPECLANNTCPFGLMNYFQVMEIESFWGPLITAGIFAATSALPWLALSALLKFSRLFARIASSLCPLLRQGFRKR